MSDDSTVTPVPDRLHLEVEALDGGAMYRDADYALDNADSAKDGAVRLPTSLVIESNGDPKASVAIDVSVWSGAQPLDVRSYQAIDIPTDHFEERDIVFSGRCARWAALDGGTAVSRCEAGTTCDPGTGQCVTNVLGTDGGAVATVADGSVDAREASLPEATPGETGGISADGGTACVPGVDTTRCYDADTPQRCISDGQWQTETACSSQGPMYCSDGSCVPNPPSCLDALYDNGCQSFEVPGGMFYRSDDSLHVDKTAPATVSGFRLDVFEVAVWRFRKFVEAVDLGWGPLPETGKHAHVNGGQGLASGGIGVSVPETGWNSSWTAMLATTASQWYANLTQCFASPWTLRADANENYPINCVTWYEAYAFCIWDGGFLPSEAEWNYAAAGGRQQRLYPWGDTDPGAGTTYAIYGCNSPGTGGCTSLSAIAQFGALPPAGQGLYGQLDLAGNMAEWTLDVYANYAVPCSDCAALVGGSQRVFRGGSYDRDKSFLYTSTRVFADPAGRFADVGFRCARVP
jgi:formylglycine-generating enzyme required for sulfatase activity